LIFIKKILVFLTVAFTAVTLKAQSKLPLSIQLKPYKKDALFHTADDKVGFTLKLKNEVKDIQRGNYYFDVRNDSGRSIYNDHDGFAITERSSFSKDITLDKKQLPVGCYEVRIYVQTNYYKDTLKHFFCYNPEEVAFADSTKPTDFFSFGKKPNVNWLIPIPCLK